jgi:uncharacterized protein YndB with AHSA1/START domain
MTQHANEMSGDTDRVRKVVHVQASAKVAWSVFTEKMSRWWPLATYKIGSASAVDALIEPRVGGRWYECGSDGSTCDWGRVLVWDPPGRLVLAWQITADWKYDPGVKTEVEIRFIPDGSGTRVELEHRGLHHYGTRAAEMRGIFDSASGWKGLLDAFARFAAEAGSSS